MIKMWRAQLVGDEKSLENLRKNYEKHIILEDDKYFLKCPQFDTLDKNKVISLFPSIKERFQHRLSLLNLYLDESCDAHLEGIIENTHEKIKIVLLTSTISGKSSLTANLTVIDRNGVKRKSKAIDPQVVPKDLEKSLKVVNKNQTIQKALYFNRDPNWYNLIKVWELIQDDIGSESEIVKKGWANRNEIDLFRCTAHNPEGAGLNARHAVSKIRGDCKKILSTLKPMELSVAASLIERLLKEWIDFYC